MTTLYRDHWIECTPAALMREVAMGPLTGRGRIWGSGDFRHYLNLDWGRSRKRRALILNLGGFIRPVITPDDTDRVKAIVEARLAGRA